MCVIDSNVFISYSRKDIDLIKEIKSNIEMVSGVKCWMDIRSIIAGSRRFTRDIVNGINQSQVFLFMLTECSQLSKYALLELNYAEEKGKHVVIINVDGCKLNDEFRLRFGLTDIIYWNDLSQREKLFNDISIWVPKTDGILFNINSVGFKMIKVDGGTFMMGATPEQCIYTTNGYWSLEEETPAHLVTLNDYYLGETVVTQSLWKAVMGDNPSLFVGEENPVENISWEMVVHNFIPKINELCSEQLQGMSFRMPTEAEWEFAARGGVKTKRFRYAGSNEIDDVMSFLRIEDLVEGHLSLWMSFPVKLKIPNELGFYDMSGNVWEWCYDWAEWYDSEPQINPKGPDSGTRRIVRGGRSCIEGSKLMVLPSYRIAYRESENPEVSDPTIGVRLALS